MDVYVLRHGMADERDYRKYPDDDLRPLIPEGIDKLSKQAKGLKSIGFSVDVVISSPLVRAVQTAEVVMAGLGIAGDLAYSEALAPEVHPYLLLEELATKYSAVDRVMVVGHEPHMSSFVSMVMSGDPNGMIRLKKGALCKLRIPRPDGVKSGWLEWLMTPDQMIRLGERPGME